MERMQGWEVGRLHRAGDLAETWQGPEGQEDAQQKGKRLLKWTGRPIVTKCASSGRESKVLTLPLCISVPTIVSASPALSWSSQALAAICPEHLVRMQAECPSRLFSMHLSPPSIWLEPCCDGWRPVTSLVKVALVFLIQVNL